MPSRFLDSKALAEVLGYTPESLRTLLWRMRRGTVPATRLPLPLATGGGRLRWSEESVETWRQACTINKPEELPPPRKPAPRKAGRPRGSRKTPPVSIPLN